MNFLKSLFTSRKVLMTVGTIAASVVDPGIMETATAIGGSFVIGQGVADSNGKAQGKKKKWKSRKFWLSIAGIAAGALFPPIAPVIKLAIPLFNLGQGVADSGLVEALSKK